MKRESRDPRLQQQHLRLSTDSIQTVSTVNTVNTVATRLPAAEYNFGHNEEDLLAMNASQTGDAFASTDSGKAATHKLNNCVLPAAQAKELNIAAIRLQGETTAAELEQEKIRAAKRLRTKKRNKLLLLALLALVGVGVSLGLVFLVLPEEGEEEEISSEPGTTIDPPGGEDPTIPTLNITGSPTASPIVLPTTSPTKSPIETNDDPELISLPLKGLIFSEEVSREVCARLVGEANLCVKKELRTCKDNELQDSCNLLSCTCPSSNDIIKLRDNNVDIIRTVQLITSGASECSNQLLGFPKEGCAITTAIECVSANPLNMVVSLCGNCRCNSKENKGAFCEGQVTCGISQD